MNRHISAGTDSGLMYTVLGRSDNTNDVLDISLLHDQEVDAYNNAELPVYHQDKTA